MGSDHSAVISSHETITSPRGNDVFTVNANLIKHPRIHAELRTLARTAVNAHKGGEGAVACVKKLKHEVRKLLRIETRKHAQRTHSEMDEVEKKLAALHLNQTNTPTPSGVNSRRLLQL